LDFKKIEAALEQGIGLAEQFLPLIPGLGQVAGLAELAIKVVGSVTDIVDHTNQAIVDGHIVADATDQAKVRDMAQKLHDINDEIAKQIDDS
jgi:hypothetical protein